MEDDGKWVTNRKSRVMEDREADCLVKYNLSAGRTKRDHKCKVIIRLGINYRFVRWREMIKHSFSVVRVMKHIMCRV